MTVPDKINMGSGRNFRQDYLNVDINPLWQPDILCDLNSPFPETAGQTFQTDRFGAISVGKNSFSLIVAYDVLEHIGNLTIFMKSCLDLLKTDGVMDIQVPYDLSYGAWQDPTHVRAFNENSWLYYTDWFWYLGWSEARFVSDKLELQMSDIGKALHRGGGDEGDLVRTPRAIDAMKVLLRKVDLSDNDRKTLAWYTAREKPAS